MKTYSCYEIFCLWQECFVCGKNVSPVMKLFCLWQECFVCGENVLSVTRMFCLLVMFCLWWECFLSGDSIFSVSRMFDKVLFAQFVCVCYFILIMLLVCLHVSSDRHCCCASGYVSFQHFHAHTHSGNDSHNHWFSSWCLQAILTSLPPFPHCLSPLLPPSVWTRAVLDCISTTHQPSHLPLSGSAAPSDTTSSHHFYIHSRYLYQGWLSASSTI